MACEPLKQFIGLTRRLFGPFGTSPNYSEEGPCKKLKYEETSILSNLTDQVILINFKCFMKEILFTHTCVLLVYY